MRALALDMGGSHIGCGLVEEDRLLISRSIEANGTSGLGALLPSIAETLHDMLSATQTETKDCLGVAIGFPGIVDARDGKIHSTLKKYEDAPTIDLQHWARETFGLPLRVENDARLALMGEQFAGAARGEQDVVMMTLGTGIGTGVIMGGHLLRGAHAHAGCLGGHLVAKFDGRVCHCGNIGCAEAEASGWSMPIVAREWPGFSQSTLAGLKDIGFLELFAHARAGDAVATAVSERCLHVWSANLVSLANAYDPSVVIVGGGVMNDGERMLPSMQEYVNHHVWSSWGKPKVKIAELGNKAALLGAIPLLREEMPHA